MKASAVAVSMSSDDEIEIRGDQRTQILTERDVDGRAIVKRADAHLENVLPRFRTFPASTG